MCQIEKNHRNIQKHMRDQRPAASDQNWASDDLLMVQQNPNSIMLEVFSQADIKKKIYFYTFKLLPYFVVQLVLDLLLSLLNYKYRLLWWQRFVQMIMWIYTINITRWLKMCIGCWNQIRSSVSWYSGS